jgi:hypothetical protein
MQCQNKSLARAGGQVSVSISSKVDVGKSFVDENEKQGGWVGQEEKVECWRKTSDKSVRWKRTILKR